MSKTVELARHLETLHINNMYKSDFYWTWDKSDEEIDAVFTVADALRDLRERNKNTKIFNSGLGISIFRDNSTRTRFSFASACNLLGLEEQVLDEKKSQIAHGETVRETANMVSFMADVIGIRDDMFIGEGHKYQKTFMDALEEGYRDGILEQRPTLVNLQCDVDHPTQCMADMLHIIHYFGGVENLKGKKVAMTWAYSPSYGKPLSVPQGVIGLFTRFGMDVTLAHPEGYEVMPEVEEIAKKNAAATGGSFKKCNDMKEAFKDADIVYPKSWAPFKAMEERTKLYQAGDKDGIDELEKKLLAQNAEHKDWACTEEMMKLTKDGKARAIPGHSLTLGALGCFILWFCWFGFNGGSTVSMTGDDTMVSAGLICFNTNLAAALATVAALIVSWVRYGKPDVSLTFNGALAGLVAITAGCDVVDPFGAAIIGIVAGVLCIFSVEFFDNVAKIDDPVGAVSVHCMNGAWGTIAVGLFATEGGLFYGGGFAKLGIQLLGIVSVAAWVLATMFIIFTVIKKTIGLRVSEKEEIDGLDYHEHGLASAYAGFAINDPTYAELDVNENTDLGEDDITKASPEKVAAAVKVVKDAPLPAELDSGMHKVSIIVQLAKFETLKKALNDIGVTGMTVTQVMGCGLQKGSGEKYRGAEVDATLLPKVKVEVVVSKIPVDKIIDTATKALYTGHIGDGKIFVYNVAKVVKVRTGEQDYAALQDVE